MDQDLLIDRKRLELEAELNLMERRLALMSGLAWQREYDLYKLLRRFKILAIETHSQEHAEAPAFKRLYPPLLPAVVSDWDFEFGYAGNYDLSTLRFVSPPSSLRNIGSTYSKISCNYPGTTNLPQGRIDSWFYKEGSSYTRAWGFICRCQYPTWENCYRVHQVVGDGVGTTWSYFYEGATQVKTALIAEPPINTWFHGRLTWWESGGWLILRLERYYTGAWHNDAGDYADETPSYGSGVRRCGFYWVGHPTTERTYTDDTCIYGPPVP